MKATKYTWSLKTGKLVETSLLPGELEETHKEFSNRFNPDFTLKQTRKSVAHGVPKSPPLSLAKDYVDFIGHPVDVIIEPL